MLAKWRGSGFDCGMRTLTSSLLSLVIAVSLLPAQTSTEDRSVVEARREIIRLEMEVERLSAPLATTNPSLKAAVAEARDSSMAMMKAIAEEKSLDAARQTLAEAEEKLAAAVKSGDMPTRLAADDAVRKATEALHEQAYAIPAIALLRDASMEAGKRLKAAREAAVGATPDGKTVIERLLAARAAAGQSK